MKYPTDQNQKATITLPGQPPRDASQLPTDLDGVKVELFELPPPTVRAFRRSDLQRLTPAQYAELSGEIANAQAHNLVVDDVTPSDVLEARDKANRKSADAMLAAIRKRDTRKAANGAFKAYESARLEFDRQSKIDPNSAESYVAGRKMNELGQAWEGLEQEAKAAQAE